MTSLHTIRRYAGCMVYISYFLVCISHLCFNSIIYAYEEVYPLFTAKKAGQGMFVFYCVIKFCVLRYGC